ncbi:hypothetical protein JYU34_013262, partial [Plutella xylostella]
TEIETMSEDFDDESDESLRERQLFEPCSRVPNVGTLNKRVDCIKTCMYSNN